MVISAAQGSLGRILSVSEGFIEMSGYLKEEITEKALEKLLPQIMGFYHEQAMSHWLTDASPAKLYMNSPQNAYFR